MTVNSYGLLFKIALILYIFFVDSNFYTFSIKEMKFYLRTKQIILIVCTTVLIYWFVEMLNEYRLNTFIYQSDDGKNNEHEWLSQFTVTE